MYRALLNVQCEDGQWRKVVVEFEDEDHYDNNECDGFDEIFDELGEYLDQYDTTLTGCVLVVRHPVNDEPDVIIDD